MHRPTLTSLRDWHAAARLLIAMWCLVMSPGARAVETLQLSIGDVSGSGWSATGVNIALELVGDDQAVARVSVSRVTFPAPLGSLEGVTLTCRNPVVEEPVFACRTADVRGKLGVLGAQRFTANVEYQSEHGTLSFSFAGLRVAGGRGNLRGTWQESGWRANVDLQSARLADLRRLAATLVELPAGLALEGTSPRLRLELRGRESLDSVTVETSLAGVAAANAAGSLATDQLALQLRAHARAEGDDWILDADVESRSGQAYVDPVFVDFGVNPGKVSLAGRWRTKTSALDISRLDFDASGVAKGNATGELDLAGEIPVRKLQLQLQSLQFPGAYTTLFRPFLGGTVLKDLETSGVISGAVSLAAGAPAAIDLRLANVTAESGDKAIAMRQLNGDVRWQSDGSSASPSELSWKSANVFGISGGAARVRFAASGDDFRLVEPTDLPIFDGGLAIGVLDVRDMGTPEMSLQFDAELRPISMAKLSTAFGWPEFAGTLAGRIPRVSLEKNVLKFAGDLEAQAFGGHIVVNGLQLRDPLGKYPRLNANATMRGLDLEAVTGTFEFGRITGRLEGEIRDLELFRWEPVRFDARFYTPGNDRSKHTISQRAVNNLSNIGGGGGGVTAALSSGFLRFFENFRYDRLGLSCRLANDVCYMDGIEPATPGIAYYIVKGSGIPRIDIIGNAHRVNWTRLVGQLRAMQSAQGPEVR